MNATLNLVLKEPYYSMTGEPGKMFELRKPTKFILSRLFDKNGNKRNYEFVEICHGYSKDRRKKLRGFKGFDVTTQQNTWPLPNGEVIITDPGNIVIWLK